MPKSAPKPAAVTANAAALVVVEPAPKPVKTTAVRFVRSHPAFGYWPGEKADIDATVAADLIAGGFAEKA